MILTGGTGVVWGDGGMILTGETGVVWGVDGMILTGEIEAAGQKMFQCPSAKLPTTKICGLTWDCTQYSAVRGRRLTT